LNVFYVKRFIYKKHKLLVTLKAEIKIEVDVFKDLGSLTNQYLLKFELTQYITYNKFAKRLIFSSVFSY